MGEKKNHRKRKTLLVTIEPKIKILLTSFGLGLMKTDDEFFLSLFYYSRDSSNVHFTVWQIADQKLPILKRPKGLEGLLNISTARTPNGGVTITSPSSVKK